MLLDSHADVLDQSIMPKPTRLCPTSELVAAFDGKATMYFLLRVADCSGFRDSTVVNPS